MCGIAGIASSAPTESAALRMQLHAMAAAQAHRGPDDEGIWLSADGRTGFAHRRLSIIDLSPAGHQPMASASGRFTICFNGEIYNYLDLRHQLVSDGCSFRGHSDTEVILAAIEKWGLAPALTRCIGMFAFAVHDQTTGTVSLVRDRIGIKPLYYAFQRGLLAFSSELKGLRQARDIDWTIAPEGLSSFLRYGYIHAPATIYQRVHKVPPGAILTFRFDGTDAIVERYWDVAAIAHAGMSNPMADADAAESLHELLSDSVARHMVSDVPVGAFLSGGIDSSTVVGLMRNHTGQRVKTFTIGFHDQRFDESTAAHKMARHFDTEHHELFVTEKDLLDRVDRLANIVDEPMADPSILPTLIVSELAAQHVKVVLSGDGGDELFLGYHHYTRGVRAAQLNRRLGRFGGHQLGQLGTHLANGRGQLARAAALLAATNMHQVYTALVSRWQDPAAIVKGGDNGQIPLQAITSGYPMTQFAPVNHMALHDMRAYMVDDILHKVDRASMACSIEVRVPILDHRVVELSWRMRPEAKWNDNIGKLPLRTVLSRYAPRTLFDRPKQGFGVPISAWLRGSLRSWAEEILHDPSVGRYFDRNAVNQLWNEHAGGRHDRGFYLWDILLFMKWHASSCVTPRST